MTVIDINVVLHWAASNLFCLWWTVRPSAFHPRSSLRVSPPCYRFSRSPHSPNSLVDATNEVLPLAWETRKLSPNRFQSLCCLLIRRQNYIGKMITPKYAINNPCQGFRWLSATPRYPHHAIYTRPSCSSLQSEIKLQASPEELMLSPAHIRHWFSHLRLPISFNSAYRFRLVSNQPEKSEIKLATQTTENPTKIDFSVVQFLAPHRNVLYWQSLICHI